MKRGNKEEKIERFERIFVATRLLLYHFVRKCFQNIPIGIEDVVQECYASLWEQLDTIRDDEKILPLLKTYATNHCINQLQKYAREKQRAGKFYDMREVVTDTYQDLHFKETMQAFREAVSSLPPQRRLIYQLVREKGMSHQDVSARLNISIKTIERHMTEALRLLRAKFPADKLAFIALWIVLHG